MPTILRGFYRDGDGPLVGDGNNALGVRPGEVRLVDGMVQPETKKGMSVRPSVRAFPPGLVPSCDKSVQFILDAYRAMSAGTKVVPTAEQQETIAAAWHDLSAEEQERLWGLSADLYQLQGAEKPEAPSQADGPRELWVPRIGEAMRSARWEDALRLLRLGPRELSQAQIAIFRGRAWQGLGHDEVGLLFFDFAVEKDLENPVPAILALHCLLRLGRLNEAVARASSYAATSGTHPDLLYKAGDVLLAAAIGSATHDAEWKYRDVIRVLEAAIKREQECRGTVGPFTGRAYAQLGLCHQLLNDRASASAAYNRAAESSPSDATVLVARGVFLYETQPDAAVEDFERAVTLGTPLVWPYFYLAHRALRHRDRAKFTALYVQAMERARSETVVAKLLEWWAITLAEMQGPNRDSLDFLNQAVALNPDDPTPRQNLRRLEELLSHPQSPNGAWTLDDFPASREAVTFLAEPDEARVAA